MKKLVITFIIFGLVLSAERSLPGLFGNRIISGVAFAQDYPGARSVKTFADVGASATRDTRFWCQDMTYDVKTGACDPVDIFGLLEAGDIPDISATYQSASATLDTLEAITYNANMLTFFAAADYAAMRVLLNVSTVDTGTNPTVAAAGHIAHDTDGGSVANMVDETLIGYDSSGNTVVFASKIKTYQFTPIDPENLVVWTGRTNPGVPVWYNPTGFTFTITHLKAWSDTDNYAFTLFETASAVDYSEANQTTIHAITCAADGDTMFGATVITSTPITHATIEAGHSIFFEDTGGTANAVQLVMQGWYNGDVD